MKGDAVAAEKEAGIQEAKPLLKEEPTAEIGQKRRSGKRKVRWNDRHGHKLVEVIEFQPSGHSDSEMEDHVDSCICSVM